MKQVFAVLLCLTFLNVQGQENTEEDDYAKEHEVKVNGLYFVIGAFDVTYEYLLSEESGLGINVFLPYDSDIKDDINYYISPYYRFYFGKKYAAGFFLEGFGMLNSVNEQQFFGFDVPSQEETFTDFALGIGVGGKWVTKGGFVGELSLGVGRNLFNSEESYEEFVAKLGVTIGYRF